MRNLILGTATLALAAIAAPGSVRAAEYPYCASGAWAGGGGCSYTTLEQCRASISGVGGSCISNPRYTPNPNTPARAPRTRR